MDRPDEALLEAAARGGGDAFAVFYRRHLPGVTGFFLRRVGDRELTFDLVAETFAAAAAGCASFRAGQAPAGAWLFGIAANKLRESLRRGRVEAGARRRLGLEPIALDDADLLRVEELACADGGAAEALVAQLPREQRDAVVARVVEERSYREIADQMHCSEAVVRQRVSRGLGRMRNELGRQAT
ncbi:MAG: RNA polymerase sigma factor [Solirubrobacteraceae bacterium MAG38_C4-C5]|nr:RNA polymerase sigma factor [Candidatus Siliceabacter maunaloa]